jgi:hypothetical protein
VHAWRAVARGYAPFAGHNGADRLPAMRAPHTVVLCDELVVNVGADGRNGTGGIGAPAS